MAGSSQSGPQVRRRKADPRRHAEAELLSASRRIADGRDAESERQLRSIPNVDDGSWMPGAQIPQESRDAKPAANARQGGRSRRPALHQHIGGWVAAVNPLSAALCSLE